MEFRWSVGSITVELVERRENIHNACITSLAVSSQMSGRVQREFSRLHSVINPFYVTVHRPLSEHTQNNIKSKRNHFQKTGQVMSNRRV